MARSKRFTVVINGDGGYSTYKVTAKDWKQARECAEKQHKEEFPDEPDCEIGCAAVIEGWPGVWTG